MWVRAPFVAMYFFETACTIQVRAMHGDGSVRLIDPSIVDGAQAQWEKVTRGAGGALAWPTLLRKLARVDTRFRT